MCDLVYINENPNNDRGFLHSFESPWKHIERLEFPLSNTFGKIPLSKHLTIKSCVAAFNYKKLDLIKV